MRTASGRCVSGRDARPQLHDLLARLADLADNADPLCLVASRGDGGDGAERFVQSLKQQVTLLKAQDWSGFDFRSPSAAVSWGSVGQTSRRSASHTRCTPLEALWTSAVRLWNLCVAARNKQRLAAQADNAAHAGNEDAQADTKTVAWVQTYAVDLVMLAPEDQLEDAHVLQRVQFCKQAGQAWLLLGEWDQAEMVLSQGTQSIAALMDYISQTELGAATEWEEHLAMAFDTQVLHLRSLWLLGQEEAAAQLRTACCTAALGTADSWQILHSCLDGKLLSVQLCGTLASEMMSRVDDLIWRQDKPVAKLEQRDGQQGKEVQAADRARAAGPGDLSSAYDLLTSCHDLLESALALCQQLKQPAVEDAAVLTSDMQLQVQQAVHQLRQCKLECLLDMMLVHVSARDGARALQCYQAAARDADAGDAEGFQDREPGQGGQGRGSAMLGSASCLSLKVKAMAMAQRLQEAEQELVCLMAHQGAPVPLCMDAVSELLSQGSSLVTLRAAVQLLHDRVSRRGGAASPMHVDDVGAAEAGGRGRKGTSGSTGDVMLAFATMAAQDSRRQEAEHEALDQLLLDVMGPGSQLAVTAGSTACVTDLHLQKAPEADKYSDGACIDDGTCVRAACHALLWNQGVRHFMAKRHERVGPILRAAVAFCAPGGEQAAKAWRTMALSCLALRQYEGALECLDAQEHAAEPGCCSVADAFIRFKVHLQLGDEAAAQQQVHVTCDCMDFDCAILEVMCQEAHKAGAMAVAKAALLQLQATLAAAAAGDIEPPASSVTEGTVMRVLIRSTLDEAARKAEGERSGDGQQGEGCEPRKLPHSELAKYFNLASTRLEAVGRDSFFGEDDGSRHTADLEWLAAMAWSSAQAAGNDGDFESCTVMLAAYASLMGMHPMPQPKHLEARRTAYVMAAASAVLVHNFRPTHAASLALASSMIASARRARVQACAPKPAAIVTAAVAPEAAEAATAACAGEQGIGAAASPLPIDALEACCVCQEVEVALRRQDEGELQRLLTDGLPAAAQLLAPGHLLQLAGLAQEGPYEHAAACQQCYRLALEQSLRCLSGGAGHNIVPSEAGDADGEAAMGRPAGPQVDVRLVAELVRKLVLLAVRDGERLQRYEEALGVVSSIACRRLTAAPGLSQGLAADAEKTAGGAVGLQYPEAELRWIISSCWNRGCHHRRLGRLKEALGYLRVAVRLLQHCPPMAAEHTAMMGEQLQAAEQELQHVHPVSGQLEGFVVAM